MKTEQRWPGEEEAREDEGEAKLTQSENRTDVCFKTLPSHVSFLLLLFVAALQIIAFQRTSDLPVRQRRRRSARRRNR